MKHYVKVCEYHNHFLPKIANSNNEPKIEEIQKIKIRKHEWNTSMLPHFTDDQLLDCLEDLLLSLNKHIIKLKKELGWSVFIDDIGRRAISAELFNEIKTRQKIGNHLALRDVRNSNIFIFSFYRFSFFEL